MKLEARQVLDILRHWGLDPSLPPPPPQKNAMDRRAVANMATVTVPVM